MYERIYIKVFIVVLKSKKKFLNYNLSTFYNISSIYVFIKYWIIID